MKKDLSAILPDGRSYDFWEKETVWTRELHVSASDPAASDDNDGSAAHPFRTVGRAAAEAQPGDRVLIHAGLYRECVRPARGGTDPEHMISYEAFGDGEVIVSASEQVTEFIPSEGWMLFRGPEPAEKGNPRVWEHDLDPDMFRGYNPFCDGKPLKQVPLYNGMAAEENTYWVEVNGQKVHFRLPGDADPRDHKIEVTVREQCFAPAIPFLNYIRVKGITFAHAATGPSGAPCRLTGGTTGSLRTAWWTGPTAWGLMWATSAGTTPTGRTR